MGLFDSIIGTANEEAEPLNMETIVEESPANELASISVDDVV